MKSSLAALATIPAIALVLASGPAHAETSSAGSLGGTSSGGSCLLGRVDRQAATTSLCLSCHDGTVAAHRDGHPVDIVYEVAVARNPRLRTRYELSRRLALPDGKISCVTCHDGASSEPMHTSLPMSRSALCFGCHAV